MSVPFVDVVIPCHDPRRAIARSVGSVFHDAEARECVRVTVVAHGIPVEALSGQLTGIAGEWRVEAFADGIRSAAGPYNRGLDLATAEYTFRLDSDDYLEPGAMRAWLAHVRAERPSAAIIPMRVEGFPVMANPLSRLGHTKNLDAARDRLFYRTAPLAFVARREITRLGLRMTPDVRVSEDLEFGVRLWGLGERVDFLWGAPCYVIGTDAPERTTLAALSIEQEFQAMEKLLDSDLPAKLSASQRKALAIKLVRVSVIGKARSRASAGDWRGDDEVRSMASTLRRLLQLAPGVLQPFNLQDRRIIDGLLEAPTVARVTVDASRANRATRRERWFTKNPLYSFSRESTLRRYALYFLKRERSAPHA